MKNKRGWIRIFEAVIAILLLLGFAAFLIIDRVEKPDFSGSVHTLLSTVLEEASGNFAIRQAVFDKNETIISNFISSRLPAGLNFTISICNSTGPCPTEVKQGVEVYADDILISTNLTTYAPAKLALFAWIEPREAEEYVPPVAACSNSKIEGTEVCDSTNLAGQTCISKGFIGGTLACNSTCGFDTSGCTKAPACTDNDKDGYSTNGGACGDVDCNDNNANVNPGVVEKDDLCSNTVDDDCDGAINDDDIGCGGTHGKP